MKGNDEAGGSPEEYVFGPRYFKSIHKFDSKPRIPGFNSSCPTVFLDERVISPEEMNELPFSQLDPGLVYEEQLKLGLEVCKYLHYNEVRDFRVLCNFFDPLFRMEEELEKMGIGTPATYSSHTQPKPLERLPNSTEVTVVLLIHCEVTNGMEYKRRMAAVIRTAMESSRSGIILLTNVGLLPIDPDDQSGLGFLLYELVSKNDAQVEKYSLQLQAENRALYKKLFPSGTHAKSKIRRLDDELSRYDWKSGLTIPIPRLGPKNYLELFCTRHYRYHRDIYSAYELEVMCPSGGCKSFCGYQLKCGRYCLLPCHALDWDHEGDFKCKKHLVPQTCSEAERHSTLLPCWETRCLEEITFTFPCTHFGVPTRKIRCFERNSIRCKVEVVKKLPCGHSIVAECGDDLKGLKCTLKVSKKLSCGHDPVTFKCCDSASFKTYVCREKVKVEASCGKHKLDVPCCEFQKGAEWKCNAECQKKCPRDLHLCWKEHPCNEPCPPCIGRLEWQQPCGHGLVRCCWEPDLENDYLCRELCEKVNKSCPRRHKCPRRCHEECGRCEIQLLKSIEGCSREHTEYRPCFQYFAKSGPCKVKVVVSNIRADCGHLISLPCHLADEAKKAVVQRHCEEECNFLFSGDHRCGHKCRGKCGSCYQGRFHGRCQETCGKKLVCGHYCGMPCSMVCPPCGHPCYNKCEHWECEKECGVPCEMNCQEPCPYKCEHSSCSNLCSEVCNKPICYEACKKLLKCGHECIGFCGEWCPPYCLQCSPEKINKDPFFYLDDDDEPPENPIRFLFLPDCGHCLDSFTMDKWMNAAEDELQPKRCPLCNTRITTLRRYSRIMNSNQKVINSIRRKIFGNEVETGRILQRLTTKLTENSLKYVRRDSKAFQAFMEFVSHILFVIDPNLTSLDKAKFLTWFVAEWSSFFERILDFDEKIKPPKILDRFIDYWRQLFEWVAARFWPLHPNEMVDLRGELVRIEDAVLMYEKVAESPQTRALTTSQQGMLLLSGAEDVLFLGRRYDKAQRDLLKDVVGELSKMLKCTLNISAKERVQVLAAFGGKAGRWFKCENGHIYVVTECGGVTEKAKCPECGVLIGGVGHKLAPSNYLATEMDGAKKPMWPGPNAL